MRLARTMMALVIALSVALLPAAGMAAPIIKSVPLAATDVMARDMAMTSDMSGMDECCPDHGMARPCNQPCDQCPLAFCAGQPMSIASASIFRFDPPMVAGNLLSIPADQVATRHGSSPPFRPPRV